MPSTRETVDARLHFVKQDGGQVFKYAVRKMEELCVTLLEEHKVDPKDVKLLIPHQANRRIIMSVAERMGIDPERVVINIDRFGNTTAATIPLATRDAVESGRLKKGDLVLFAAVGAGFTAGANLWRWQM
jgi:3-oxoacyl-[acyl-carrier-protein] synthase-3